MLGEYVGKIYLETKHRPRFIVEERTGSGPREPEHAAAVLIRQGYRAVTLKGGIAEWLAANLPIETKEAPKMATPEPGALKG